MMAYIDLHYLASDPMLVIADKKLRGCRLNLIQSYKKIRCGSHFSGNDIQDLHFRPLNH